MLYVHRSWSKCSFQVERESIYRHFANFMVLQIDPIWFADGFNDVIINDETFLLSNYNTCFNRWVRK